MTDTNSKSGPLADINTALSGTPPDISILTHHVEEILRLGKRAIEDVVEIGRRLVACQDIVDHGDWLSWLDREFSWSEATARNYMRLYELAQAKSVNFADLNLPVSALYLIAAPNTPAETCDELLDRAAAGERMSHLDFGRSTRRRRARFPYDARYGAEFRCYLGEAVT
jgi:hypothetical protein